MLAYYAQTPMPSHSYILTYIHIRIHTHIHTDSYMHMYARIYAHTYIHTSIDTDTLRPTCTNTLFILVWNLTSFLKTVHLLLYAPLVSNYNYYNLLQHILISPCKVDGSNIIIATCKTHCINIKGLSQGK